MNFRLKQFIYLACAFALATTVEVSAATAEVVLFNGNKLIAVKKIELKDSDTISDLNNEIEKCFKIPVIAQVLFINMPTKFRTRYFTGVLSDKAQIFSKLSIKPETQLLLIELTVKNSDGQITVEKPAIIHHDITFPTRSAIYAYIEKINEALAKPTTPAATTSSSDAGDQKDGGTDKDDKKKD